MYKKHTFNNENIFCKHFYHSLKYLCGYLLLIAFCVIESCTSNKNVAGTSSGTEAKIAQGSIVQENGTAAVHARVKLIPVNYNPVTDAALSDSSYGITDVNGSYKLYAADTGTYNIEAVLDSNGNRLFIRHVHLLDSHTEIPQNTLHKPGAIEVSIPDDADTVNGYLYLPGTDIAVALRGKSGSVILDSVPETVFPAICYKSTKSITPTVLENNVAVQSSDTVVVVLPEWKYSKHIYLNTTSSGANLSGIIKGFPLLVRLDKNNFDFSQSLPGGDDIRFTCENGSQLPFEIEQWDNTTKQAVLWVKVDAVYGNDSTHSITMHWGNSAAGSKSNSRMVFDTAAGFQGVWHLDESSGQLNDVSQNGYNGARKGNQTRSSGVIGYSQYLDGSGDFTEMGNACNPGSSGFTFCAWVKRAVTGKRQTIASKSAGGSASGAYGWLIELDPDGALFFFMASDTGAWGSTGTFVLASNKWITDTTWHFISVVADRSGENKSRLYIDGSDVSSLPANGITTVGAVVNSMPLRFGTDANGGNPWAGYLDECSIFFGVRSEEWIRLSYLNQKTGSQLIKFK